MGTVEHELKLRGDADVFGRVVERRQRRQERAGARVPRSWNTVEGTGRKAWF